MKTNAVTRALLQLGTALTLLTTSVVSQAGTVTITVNQVGSDIVMTGAGSLDLTGLTFVTSQGLNQVYFEPTKILGNTGGAVMDFYNAPGSVFSAPIGAAIVASTLQSTGNHFGFFDLATDRLYVPQGYTSNSALAFTWTFTNATVANNTFNWGTIATFGTNSNTIVLVDGAAAAVPVPAAAPLFLTALGALGWLRRRRNRAIA